MSEARFAGSAWRCAPYLVALVLLPACQPGSGDAPGPGPPPATVEETDRTVFLDDGVVRVGIDKRWGGAIRELWYGGRDLVNAYDGGRLAWVSLYDAAASYDPDDVRDPGWGWNPTPSDKYDHPNPTLAWEESGGGLVARSTSLHWNPDDKGGGPATPVAADVAVEARLAFVPGHPRAVRLDLRAEHLGSDLHRPTGQEFPFLYLAPELDRIVRYAGDRPWTGGAVREGGAGRVRASERWVAFVDDEGDGLTLFAPFHYPLATVHRFAAAPHEDDAGYVVPFLPQRYGPGQVHATTVFLVPGPWRQARATIASLRDELDLTSDRAAPHGTIDLPFDGARWSGSGAVAGWAVDDVGVREVEVFLDGASAGRAAYGGARPDVAADYPGLPDGEDVGFGVEVDASGLAPGEHALTVALRDAAGNEQLLGPRTVMVE